LVEKFGKEFALQAMEGTGVADRVLSKLKVETPPRELVDAYLREIARTYVVRFPGDPIEISDDEEEDDDDEGSGGVKVKALEAPLEAEELSRATPPKEVGGMGSPLRITPPSPSTDHPSSKLKLPGGEKPKPTARRKSSAASADKAKATKDKKDGDGGGPGGKIPDVDELARRFAELKR
jgi:vacuolar protein sorting-associated protein IST1